MESVMVPLAPAKRREERAAQIALIEPALLGANHVEKIHGEHPQKARGQKHEGEPEDEQDERGVRDAHVLPRVLHGQGQLGSQKHEHDAVQGVGEHVPHAARDDVHARDRRPDNPLGRRDVDEPGHHHGR